MKYIAIVDTETTGLDPAKGKLIEFAAILYHIPTRSIVTQASTLIHNDSNEAYEVNRIEVETLKNVPDTVESQGRFLLMEILRRSDAIIAHNAEFDRKWIEAFCPQFRAIVQSKKWICTRNDVVWPLRKGTPLNLIAICAELGVPIINAHRALNDCLMLLNAIECMDEIDSFLDKSGQGRIIYYANINYDQRQLAKDEGFLWDNLKKVWYAKLTPEKAATIPFMIYPAEIQSN